jgi:hypothetical protein
VAYSRLQSKCLGVNAVKENNKIVTSTAKNPGASKYLLVIAILTDFISMLASGDLPVTKYT